MGQVPVVWLEAGDFFGDPTPTGDMQNKMLIKGMSFIRYAAANVGPRELAGGIDKFLKFSGAASFPFVSANLVTDPGGKPFVEPYVVHEIDVRAPGDDEARRLRIGIIGFTAHKRGFLKATPDNKNLVTIPPVEALERWLPKLRRKADLLVALVAMRYEEALALAQAAEEMGMPLDFVLGGMGDFVTRDEASMLGSTKVVYSGNMGKRLGEVRVFLDAERKPARSVFDAIWLTKDYPGNPDLESMVGATLDDMGEWFSAHQTFGSPLTPVVIGSSYTGAGRCKSCHEQAFAVWEDTVHAHALDTLVRERQMYNPECLLCHTTGYRKAGGYIGMSNTPQLAHIQCESCHGASGTHPESRVAGFGKAGIQSCLPCHTRENSPEFNFSSYWERIRH
ncbi:MAG: multiheme c-type cytochrome [Acidobacteria bacterium]|nr:multiheme c-type cytochrome [Acidobacteriota bacterium]